MLKKHVIWSTVLMLFCISGMVMYASMTTVPVTVQSAMLIKALSYDRSILKKDGDMVRIGIVYNENNDESMKNFELVGDLLYEQKKAGKKIGKKRIKSTGLSYQSASALGSMIANLGIAALYVTPGNDANVAAISSVAQSKGVLTFGGSQTYVNKGLALGVEMESGKPRVLVNLANAKAQGANFKAEFLKIAKVVGK